jgi:4-hydroxy-3-methylbut-2-enyl diphosphate reductase
MIRIEVDKRSGFCTGVVKAVKAAEENLDMEGTLYSLGEIVHNAEEVGRLREKGLKPIDYEDFSTLQDATVLIRAHGEPPETFRHAEKNNIRLIDTTCPIVLKLQKQIRGQVEEFGENKGSILIFGKSDHPEVRALVGQTKGRAKVIRRKEELDTSNIRPPLALFSQTTMNTLEYARLQQTLKEYMSQHGWDTERELVVYHSICGQVSSRDSHIREFGAKFDLVFFVSGKNSSNGKALFEACREVNKNTYFISSPEESDEIELKDVTSIGVCGATSSPMWLLSAVKDRVSARLNIKES